MIYYFKLCDIGGYNMGDLEHIFDINRVLKNSYLALKQLKNNKYTELIFDMDTTIPRELRGNETSFQELLSRLLSFVFQHTNQNEILLSLSAPEDFLYEESITFKITNTQIPKEKILAFLETELSNNLEVLNGTIVYDSEADIDIRIPFIIGELGFRRHYRLPSKSMLHKKVLLIVNGENITRCIGKMFKYFPYNVDFGFKEDGINLAEYDLVIMEDNLVTESFFCRIGKVQEEKNIKYVILGNDDINVNYGTAKVSTHLSKPVTQESIFELIISLFEYDKPKEKKKILVSSPTSDGSPASKMHIPDSLKNKSENSSINEIIEKKKSKHVSVLDTRRGLENAKKKGLLYSQELENFLVTFDKSDLYFRQIVNEKQTNKIKDFCIDLEKISKIIGAESMQKFSDIVSLIFVYDKLDMLPIYPGRYHIELRKLVTEIKKYLHIR